MLLLRGDAIDTRRAAAAGPLRPLADSLSGDLDAVIAHPLYFPRDKALLSRRGGRCEHDGALLEFDPFSPDEHRCATCGAVYRGELHHRWWVYWYQLWLAERAVHGAALWLLRGDERHRRFAQEVLRGYSERYLAYPNRDNVLGPTRLFFSTYLESIWLLQICIAVDLLEAGGDRGVGDAARDRVIEPSAALIGQYDEGFSNRQVWNNAALMASALLLGKHDAAEYAWSGPTGVEASIANGLLSDGTWYEGENYHLFAHRGLWYGVALAETAGFPIDAPLAARFQDGFATPFATALPDFTFPSRKDSQYAVSLRQWRFAEQCELGLARADDRRLVGALARLYATDVPRGNTGRSESAADVERNVPASALTRADLGWRSLLHARASLPALEPVPPRSIHLEHQGYTVFRREFGDVYVALDWGQSGGGHGHPDRLNVLFATGNSRWLDDLGTGSYVDQSLHWYRSTLAHNAPMVGGRSQRRVAGEVIAYDERGGFGWIQARAWIDSGTEVRRALVVTPDYFVDEIRWASGAPARFELPIHFAGDAGAVTFTPHELAGGPDPEDGFAFVRDAAAVRVPAGGMVELSASSEQRTARACVCADRDVLWFRAMAPGQPARIARPFYLVRTHAADGAIRSVWAWSQRVTAAHVDGDRITVELGNERHEHRLTSEHWQVELSVGSARSGIELTGWRAPREPEPAARHDDAGDRRAGAPRHVLIAHGRTATFELGEQNYRRSEETWAEAGRPTARVSIGVAGDELLVDVDARTDELVYVDDDSDNPYDNEHPDINGHGVQLLVASPDGFGAWLATPMRNATSARVRTLGGPPNAARATWNPTAGGFAMHFRVALPRQARGITELAVVAIVNETAPSRERRRGQLVLAASHVAGDFVYLRGDRFDGIEPVLLRVAP